MALTKKMIGGYLLGRQPWDQVVTTMPVKGVDVQQYINEPTKVPGELVIQKVVLTESVFVEPYGKMFEVDLDIAPTGIIPKEIQNVYASEADVVSTYSAFPATLPEAVAMGAGVGSMLIMRGASIIAAFAYMAEVGFIAGSVKHELDRGYKVLKRTGRGHGRGRYVRLRGSSGAVPGDDADPYEEDGSKWYNPFTWL